MDDIQFIRSELAARIGFDITDYHVISYFELESFLFEAAKCGDLNSVKYAASHGVDIHAAGEKVLNIAVMRGHLSVVEYVVFYNANTCAQVANYALCLASYYGRLNMVEKLVSWGANIHANNDYALRLTLILGASEQIPVFEYLVSQGARLQNIDYALQETVHYGNLNMVKYLVTQGANVHANNDYALLIAETERQSAYS